MRARSLRASSILIDPNVFSHLPRRMPAAGHDALKR
jgi:hypothetical protein